MQEKSPFSIASNFKILTSIEVMTPDLASHQEILGLQLEMKFVALNFEDEESLVVAYPARRNCGSNGSVPKHFCLKWSFSRRTCVREASEKNRPSQDRNRK